MGVAERKAREKQARRQAILDAARDCFFRDGYEATTISQIADEVELSTGTLYLYFKNKEEIYVSILVEGLDILYALMKGAEPEGGVPADFTGGPTGRSRSRTICRKSSASRPAGASGWSSRPSRGVPHQATSDSSTPTRRRASCGPR